MIEYFLIGALIGCLLTLVVIWGSAKAVWMVNKIKSIKRKQPIYSGSNNCRGEWKNDCPYAVCECAKAKQMDLEEDYRQEYTSVGWSVAFWVFFFIAAITSVTIFIMNL